MSEQKKQHPEGYTANDVVEQFSVTLEETKHSASEKLQFSIEGVEKDRFKKTLQLVVDEVKKMEANAEIHRESLIKISSASSMTCEYYPCGSCQGDRAAVCCYYDAQEPPICVCEEC